MKLSNLLVLVQFSFFIVLTACNDKKMDPASESATITLDSNGIQDPALAASSAVSGSEFHFKCPKNCEGGGSTNKGNCPICGTELEHNQAFHSQSAGTEGVSPENSIKVDPINATGAETNPVTTVQPPAPSAAQNAKGIWHFTCPKGCEGGAGAAGKCPKCGGDLAHNQAYH